MIILDTEMTGLNPERNSLVSIAALDFNDPDDRFYGECRIWEGAEINDEALVINGLTHEELVDETRKSESDMVQNFIEWALAKKDLTVAGQNPSKDVAFINTALKRAGRKESLPYRTFDQHTLAIAHHIQNNVPVPLKAERSALDSDEIMKYVGLPSEPKPHVGINGAIWEFEAIHRLLYGVGKLEEFSQYPVPNY